MKPARKEIVRRMFSLRVQCFNILASMCAVFCHVWIDRALAADSSDHFTKAATAYQWSFPKDFGQHPDYETEWWYYTGQLYDPAAKPFLDRPRFGFQLTFFRKGIYRLGAITSDYMAHAVITDIDKGRVLFESRMGGGPVRLAGVGQGSHEAWSGDWRIEPNDRSLSLRFNLFDPEVQRVEELVLNVSELSKPWLQGIRGFSSKGGCVGCASLYYSLPRLEVTGEFRRGDEKIALHGLGWMDHEFMSNSLAPSQQGWDWLGLMFKDGRSLMVFRVRSAEGERDQFISAGMLMNSVSRTFGPVDCSLEPIREWKSPHTGARYPIEWRVRIPSEGIDLQIRARVSDSELRGPQSSGAKEGSGITYWEGPVSSADESVVGYLEMTGYAGKLEL